MNPFQLIFGGSNQQQQSVSTSTSGGQSQSTSTPGNFNPFTAALSPSIMNLVSGVGNPFASFMPGGPYAAPMSAGEGAVYSGLPQGPGSSPAASSYVSDLLGGKYLPGSPNFDSSTLNAAIGAAQRPTLTGLNNVLAQDLPSQFIQSGQVFNPRAPASGANTPTGSTAFDTAAGRAVNTAAQTISDIASTMTQNVYNTERQLQQGGVQLSQGELQSTIQNLQAQSLPRMIQQYGIDQGVKVFQSTVSSVLDFLKTLGGIAAPGIANQGQATANQFAGATSTATGTGTSTPGLVPDITSLFSGNKSGGGSTPFGNLLGAFG